MKFLPASRPSDPIGGEVEPELFGAHLALVHHLQSQAALLPEQTLVQSRGLAGKDDVAGQVLEQHQQVDMACFA